MSEHVYFAPAKLNLFLHVVGRRDDGYHLLETVFQLVDFGDTLQIESRGDGAIVRHDPLPGVDPDADLTVRAAHALRRATGAELGANIRVVKRIPLGGGLGGGSSDAATTLLALNSLWGLDLPRRNLAAIALTLGADVPVFVHGRNAFARGIGEELTALDLPRRWFVVLEPPCMVPTAAIFSAPELTRNSKLVKIQDFVADAGFPGSRFRNDLEEVAKRRYPPVAEALDWLRQHDALADVSARMTGSGACVFSGFARREVAEAVFAQLPAGWKGFVAAGLDRHPQAIDIEG
ncbi:MAG: 4-(cytidine 5'-diphospho)-2-C-methyl-D-erythritol kinase [Burkholderiales bacterium]